jgi:ubiquinone/menaquinone biosynthesis C-methylase UbiE
MSRATAVRDDVPDAFDEVAHRYDLMVRLNPGYHAALRQAAGELVDALGAIPDQPALRMLDLGCGSGASTAELARALQRWGRDFELLGVDGSAGMLEQARAKDWPANVSFRQLRAQELREDPQLRTLTPFHGVLAAYLVRNVPDPDDTLSAVHDLLAPGGVAVVHEYAVRSNLAAMAVWTAVCWSVVIPLGFLTSGRTRLYRHLWRSVMAFDSPDRLRGRLARAGFADVEVVAVGGWQRGILHTFVARKATSSEG